MTKKTSRVGVGEKPKKTKTSYSVLMSVYAKEKPEFLRESMLSIYNQTVPTDDFVLVCDGPLNEGLNEVINEMQKKFGKRLRVFRLSENRGLGLALRFGVEKCKNELIARMDSDDVAVENRIEIQLKVFEKYSDLSVVGGYVAEFKELPKDAKNIRKVPETNIEIIKFSRKRNPLNHPTVMFKKKDVVAVGNYQNIRFCQDYFLWINLLSKGYKCYNIQKILVFMREDENTFKRRSGMRYFKIQKKLIKQMRRLNFISNFQYMESVSIRFCSAFAPNWLRQRLFNRFMRREIE